MHYLTQMHYLTALNAESAEQMALLPEEVRHASRNADSACPFMPSRQYKAESAFCDACRTSSALLHLTRLFPRRKEAGHTRLVQ